MKLRQAVSQIRASFKWLNSDNLITDRAIASELKSVAYLLVKRQTDKRKLLGSNTLFTQVDCLEMERVPLAECCSYTSPCDIGKSVLTIPKIAENVYGLLIQGVYSIDKKVRFNYMDPNRYTNYLRLYPTGEQRERVFWIQNNHLYITDPNIQTVTLSAFFEEDIDLSIYGCNRATFECPTNPLDLEFKCPGFLLNDVFSVVRDNLSKTYKNSQADDTENNRDESK